MNTLEQFAKMVRNHDLTYQYSDDARYWRAGEESMTNIRIAAKELPREEVVKIWNAEVDRKLVEGYREPFYW